MCTTIEYGILNSWTKSECQKLSNKGDTALAILPYVNKAEAMLLFT
jgi:hypothetical protein